MRNKLWGRMFAVFVMLMMVVSVTYGISYADPVNGATVTNKIISNSDNAAKLEIIEAMVEDGITIGSDITIKSHSEGSKSSIGTFVDGDNIVDFSDGVILSTGDAKSVEGPTNTTGDTSTNWGDNSTDADLNSLVSTSLKDETIVTFSVVPEDVEMDKQISFQYVVASEEHNEYIDYSDVFGLFVTQDTDGSGNPTNYKNLALLPDGSTTIQIGTVNYQTNSTYYRNNSTSKSQTSLNLPSEMDGFTSVFSVTEPIDPTKPVYVKLAIADYSDNAYDSNVFIKMNSVKFKAADPGELDFVSWNDSNIVTVTRADSSGYGVDGTVLADYALLNDSGQTIQSGQIQFKDGSATATIEVTDSTARVEITNPTNGAILKNDVAMIYMVKDFTAPVLTLTGSETVTLTAGDAYTDAGASATDQPGDLDLTDDITDDAAAVDVNTPGVYIITYNVSDASGNAATPVTRTVTVKPGAPTVTGSVNGLKTLDVTGATPNATVTLYDKNNNVVASATADGSGKVTFTDVSVDEGYTVKQTVNGVSSDASTTADVGPDTTAPVLTLTGDETVTLTAGDTYTDAGASATDQPGDLDLTDDITDDSAAVDVNTPGVYIITYNVSDASGNAATPVTRTVTVKPGVPTVTGSVNGLKTLDVTGATPSATVTLYDKNNNVVSSTTADGSGNVTFTDVSVDEGYTVKQTVNGVSSDASTTADVGPDTTAPVLTLTGSETVTLTAGDTYTDAGASATDQPGDLDLTDDITDDAAAVDVNTPGVYIITYNVSDASGNAATPVTRTVTVKPGVPTVTGSVNGLKTLDVTGATPSATVTLYDKNNNVVSSTTADGSGKVTFTDVSVDEGYTVKQTVNGVSSDASTTADVGPDTTAPVLTLTGSETVTLTAGDAYTDAGALATDQPGDLDLTDDITDDAAAVDVNTPGVYIITYNVSDATGNAATPVTRTVTVKPGVPTITGSVNGLKTLDVTGATPNATVTLYDKNNNVVASATADGSGKVTFTDVSVDEGYTVKQTVNGVSSDASTTADVGPDTTAPVLTLTGSETVTLTAGDAYTDAGALATDHPGDLDLTDDITDDAAAVDVNTPGVYIITYNVSDASGNAATPVTRTVTVKPGVPTITGSVNGLKTLDVTGATPSATVTLYDKNNNVVSSTTADGLGNVTFTDVSVDEGYTVKQTVNGVSSDASSAADVGPDTTAPVLTLTGDETVTLTAGDAYTDAGASATDQPGDLDLTDDITDDAAAVDVNTPGVYTITYNVSDASGNAATPVTRTVTVKPAVPAVTGSVDGLKTVTVSATPGAEVKLYDKAGNLLAKKTADASGNVRFDDVDPDDGYDVTQTLGGVESDCSVSIDVKPDVNAPVLTVVSRDGKINLEAKVGEVYRDPGAIAIDAEEGDITFKMLTIHPFITGVSYKTTSGSAIQTTSGTAIEVTSGSALNLISTNAIYVNESGELEVTSGSAIDITSGSAIDIFTGFTPEEPGTFNIVYYVKDLADNFAQAVRTLIIKPMDLNVSGSVDGKKVVTVTGAEPGAEVNLYDAKGNLVDTATADSKGKVIFMNVTPADDYTASQVVNGVASDASDSVDVGADKGAPVITLRGEAEITLVAGALYADAGADAEDPEEGDLTDKIKAVNQVNTSEPGRYYITYNVEDSTGNKAAEKVRTLIVIPQAPSVTGSENGIKTVTVTGAIPGAAVTLYDESGVPVAVEKADVSGNVIFTGVTPDDGYFVKQTMNGETSKASEKVNVEADATLPVLKLLGDEIVTLTEGDVYSDAGALAIDQPGAVDISDRIVDNVSLVDTSTPGVYLVTYHVSDETGNEASPVSRTVIVKPASPVIKGSAGPDGIVVVKDARPGAQVKLYDGQGNVIATGTADDEGSVTFEDIPEGGGYQATQTLNGVESDKSNKSTVYKTINVGGSVTERDHSIAIENALVELYDMADNLIQSTVADENGIFDFEDPVPAGIYIVRSEKTPYQDATRMLDVSDANTAEYDSASNEIDIEIEMFGLFLELEAMPSAIVGDGEQVATLTTKVLDENKDPIADIEVVFEATKGTFVNGNTAITDENGIAQVQLKSEKIESVDSQKIPIVATVNDEEKGLYAQDRIYMTFEPSSIKGVVRDNATGTPIAGAKVEIEKDFDGDGIVEFRAVVETDENGIYTIPVPKGNTVYDITVTQTVTVGEKEVELSFTQKGEVGAITGVAKEEFEATNTAVGLITVVQPDASTAVFEDTSVFTLRVQDEDGNTASGITSSIGTDGTFISEGLTKGKTYTLDVVYTFDSGEEMVIGEANISVAEDGEINISQILIDPYGTITDSSTGQVIQGVYMQLYYANTARNVANGKTPGTLVNLPALSGFPPANNANPQYSDATGQYAWMVFPTTDYYLVGTKNGYQTYVSPQISVEKAIVRHDFSMDPIQSSSKKKKNSKSEETNAVVIPEEEIPAGSPDTSKVGITIFTDKEDMHTGDTLNVDIVVENLSGNSNLEDSTITMDLPEGFSSETVSEGSVVDGKLVVDIHDLEPGTQKHVRLKMKLDRAPEGGRLELDPMIKSASDNQIFMDLAHIDVNVYDELYFGEHKAYISGYPDETVRPDDYVTRAEMAVIFTRISDMDASSQLEHVFKDVSEAAWYAPYIDFVQSDGVMIGYGDGTFRPNENMTRAELASAIAVFADIVDQSPYVSQDAFEDISGHWANLSINEVERYHYVAGYGDGTFRPDSFITRAETVTLINNMLNRHPFMDMDIRFSDMGEEHWAFGDIMEASENHLYTVTNSMNEQVISVSENHQSDMGEE